MVVANVARRGVAPHQRITAYLRLLGRRRSGRVRGLGSLRDEIEPRLLGVVADALGVEPAQLAGDVALRDDLAVDSLDLLELLGCVEEAFGVVIPDREAAGIRTIDDLTALTTALVACRMRVRDDADLEPTMSLRVGGGLVPRFLRTVDSVPYERELLRDELRRAPQGEPVAVRGVDERTVLQASLAGTEVRTEPRDVRATEPVDEGARAWPAERLAAVWTALVGRLAVERDVAVARLDGRDDAAATASADARDATDADVHRFRDLVDVYFEVLAHGSPTIQDAAREIGRLGLVRRSVDERGVATDEVRDAYDGIAATLADAVDSLRGEARPRRRPPRAATGGRGADRQELRA